MSQCCHFFLRILSFSSKDFTGPTLLQCIHNSESANFSMKLAATLSRLKLCCFLVIWHPQLHNKWLICEFIHQWALWLGPDQNHEHYYDLSLSLQVCRVFLQEHWVLYSKLPSTCKQLWLSSTNSPYQTVDAGATYHFLTYKRTIVVVPFSEEIPKSFRWTSYSDLNSSKLGLTILWTLFLSSPKSIRKSPAQETISEA